MVAELDAADWSLHDGEFDGLRIVTQQSTPIPGMRLAPPDLSREDWEPLYRAWLSLSPHPNMLEVLEAEPPTLRYAAIDWNEKPQAGDAFPTAIKIAHVFAHVVARVDRKNWVYFLVPKIVFDLRGEPRVWWTPVWLTHPRIAPEAKSEWLEPTEKLLVYALGQALTAIGLDENPKGRALVSRCLARPILRTRKVADVVRALAAQLRMELPGRNAAWDLVETGVGWLSVDRLSDARDCFTRAMDLKPSKSMLRLATIGLTRATTAPAFADLGKARRLETEKWWQAAAAEYRLCRPLMTAVDYHVSLARCAIGVGEFDVALALAIRGALAAPDDPEPYRLIIPMALETANIRAAAVACEQLVALSPELALEPIVQTLESAIGRGKLSEARVCLRALANVVGAGDPAHAISILDKLVARVSNDLEIALVISEHLYALSPDRGLVVLIDLVRSAAARSSETAVGICERIHALAPEKSIGAFSIVVESAFQRGEIAAALGLADSMISRFPTSGLAHYRRGRCLFGLGRLLEAREVLERAQVLDPQLLDAMLLRREVDRALGKVRAVVGSAFPQQLAIPEHLPEVKAAMARGSIPDAVSWLEGHEIGDGEARLLLGQLLIGQERYLDAVRAFERVGGEQAHVAHVGKARALAAMGRGEEALRLLDRVCAEAPESTEAVVVRARVVDLLRSPPVA